MTQRFIYFSKQKAPFGYTNSSPQKLPLEVVAETAGPLLNKVAVVKGVLLYQIPYSLLSLHKSLG
jgi:hypothetical protein